jgi:hypothetical protein
MDISLVTLSKTVYIEDISSIRWNKVDISDSLTGEFPEGNPEYIALSRLREYKNREGLNIYDDVFYRTRVGRTTGSNIDFTNINYEDRKMRRKAEVLKYTSNSLTKHQEYRRTIGLNNKISQAQLKQLRDTQAILNCEKTTGLCNSIVYNKNVPFEDKL